MKKQWVLTMAAVLAFAGLATAQEASSDGKAQSALAKQIQLLEDEELVKYLATQSGDKWAEIMNAIFGGEDNALKSKVIGAGEQALNSMGENAPAVADKVNANVPAVTVVKEEDGWKIKAKDGAAAGGAKEKEDSKNEDVVAGTGLDFDLFALIEYGNEIEQGTETDRTVSGKASKK